MIGVRGGLEGSPVEVLTRLVPDAVEAIQDLVRRTTVDGSRRADQWGRSFRQPLVVRTETRGQRFWTGVADLPGEMFAPDRDGIGERRTLRRYDGLLWTVDPAVTTFATTLHTDPDFARVLSGSLRPGPVDAEAVRVHRERIQTDIGRTLGRTDGYLLAREGARMSLHVAVTKCDLLHWALRNGAGLVDLGEPGAALRGAAGYLAVLAGQWLDGTLDVPGKGADLVGYLVGSRSTEPRVRQARALQVASALLTHYSDPGAFWNLVHAGAADEIGVPPGDDVSTPPYRLRVPPIGEHIEASTRPGPAIRIELRDIVMSAVGSGVFYALGYEHIGHVLMREPWLRVRYLLCSALGTVPVAGPEDTLVPLDLEHRLPRLDDRSAGLTHTLLDRPLTG